MIYDAISIKLGINTSNWEAALGILPSETNNPYVTTCNEKCVYQSFDYFKSKSWIILFLFFFVVYCIG